MNLSIKARLCILGKKSVDLLAEIKKRGYPNLHPTQLSAYMTRAITTPQAEAVLELAEEIVEEWESNPSVTE